MTGKIDDTDGGYAQSRGREIARLINHRGGATGRRVGNKRAAVVLQARQSDEQTPACDAPTVSGHALDRAIASVGDSHDTVKQKTQSFQCTAHRPLPPSAVARRVRGTRGASGGTSSRRNAPDMTC